MAYYVSLWSCHRISICASVPCVHLRLSPSLCLFLSPYLSSCVSLSLLLTAIDHFCATFPFKWLPFGPFGLLSLLPFHHLLRLYFSSSISFFLFSVLTLLPVLISCAHLLFPFPTIYSLYSLSFSRPLPHLFLSLSFFVLTGPFTLSLLSLAFSFTVSLNLFLALALPSLPSDWTLRC